MANRILKGLAIAAGTGLAMGFGSGRSRVRPVYGVSAFPNLQAVGSRTLPASSPRAFDEVLNLEPLLDRLERMEARFELLDENTRELALLRDRVSEAERAMAESVASVQRRLDETREEIPAIVERTVAVRIDDLRTRLEADIEHAQQRTLAAFERVVGEKVSVRIDAIERALGDHAVSIDALRVRAAETDSNLQRLVGAIEKLCERAQLFPQQAEPARTVRQPMAFESQLHDAMEREPIIAPVIRQQTWPEPPTVPAKVAAPAFTSIDAPPRKKSRFLFRNSVIAVLGFFGARFLQ